MMWRILHATVAVHWALFLVSLAVDLAEHGDLPRAATQAGHFQASFVLYFAAVLVATVASAARSFWMGRNR